MFAISAILALHLSLFGFIGGDGLSQSNVIDFNEQIRLERAQKIDAYFAEREMPLEGYGLKMVIEAEKYNLDWRLLPAIAAQESGGGKHAVLRCTHNPFGWNSCRVRFSSTDHAIESVALNLAGANEKTAKYYRDTSTKEKLYHYNGTVVADYPDKVLSIMETIESGA